jgi:site-specific DNA-cytosine methylase
MTFIPESVASTLSSGGHPGSNLPGCHHEDDDNLVIGSQIDEGAARPLVARASGYRMGVRRLTPLECERLQGWADDWTRYTADGKEIPDSHRYRCIGNGVVAPVAEWIGHRLVEADAW